MINFACNGLGIITCLCGGDFCICLNYGEIDCEGCSACEGFGEWLDDCEARCACCDVCQPMACGGVQAGGVCDQMCTCEPEPGS